MQRPLFPEDEDRPTKMGPVNVSYDKARSILTAASGFMSSYDFTLNPYSGCAFGCTYCYAAFFTKDQELTDTWGSWVKVKENALALLRGKRSALAGKRIYMSSVTDPYQPVERHLRLTRSLLEELVLLGPRLVIQTRSPLVTRDIDVLRRLEHVQVNMTVTTDSEAVRRAFEPSCPSNKQRLAAIAEVANAGIPCAITMTPLLPVEAPTKFARDLRATGVRKFVIQPFHAERGRFIAGTGKKALSVVHELNWSREAYERVRAVLSTELPGLSEGREGFAPV